MKRKRMLRTLTALGLTAAMLLGGCGAQSSGTTAGTAADAETGENTAAAGEEERPTITIALVPMEKVVYDDSNYAISWIEEQTGINMEFVMLPSSDAETKLNLMLASGDYPDVILYGLNKQKTVQFGQEGIFIPINDLYE